MRVRLECGNRCWNKEVNERFIKRCEDIEQKNDASDSTNLRLIAGALICGGCIRNQEGAGYKCTAQARLADVEVAGQQPKDSHPLSPAAEVIEGFKEKNGFYIKPAVGSPNSYCD